MADIDALIARPIAFNPSQFDPIGAYSQGQDFARQQGLQREFSQGLPRGSDGQIDFPRMLDTLARYSNNPQQIMQAAQTAAPYTLAPQVQGALSGQSSAAPSSDTSVPRGIRNNNPLNLEASPFTQQQPGFAGSDGRFGRFQNQEQGMAAADRLLQSYSGRGIGTIAGVINRWAPSSDGNNSQSYAATVARAVGVDPNTPIDLNDPGVRQRVLGAMAQVENGRALPTNAQPTGPAPMPPAQESAPSPQNQSRPYQPEMSPRAQQLLALLAQPGLGEGQRQAIQLELQRILPRPPVTLQEGATLVDPNTGATLAHAPGKAQSVREGGALVQDGRVVYQAPDRPQNVAPGGTLVRNGQPIFQSPANQQVHNVELPDGTKGVLVFNPQSGNYRIASPQELQPQTATPQPANSTAPPAPPPTNAVPPVPPGANAREWRDFWTKRLAAQTAGAQSRDRQGNIVIDDIDRVLSGLDAPGMPTTGPVSSITRHLPGTNAYNVGQLLETVKTNAGFDRLQQMRDSSPTGGALGAVSDFENRMLQQAIGNLNQSQEAQQFKDNLRRVKNIYLDIIHGQGNGPAREPLSYQQPREPQQRVQNSNDVAQSLANARAAIEQGKPRAAVIKKLIDAGVPPAVANRL